MSTNLTVRVALTGQLFTVAKWSSSFVLETH